MGMSLNTKVIYGWYIGNEDNVSLPEGFDYYEFSEDELNKLTIETANYCDYQSYFVAVKEITEYSWKPIKIDDLKKDWELSMSDRKDLDLIREKLGWKTSGLPQWYAIGEYF